MLQHRFAENKVTPNHKIRHCCPGSKRRRKHEDRTGRRIQAKNKKQINVEINIVFTLLTHVVNELCVQLFLLVCRARSLPFQPHLRMGEGHVSVKKRLSVVQLLRIQVPKFPSMMNTM